MFASTVFYVGQTLVGPVSELDNAKWITQTQEMRTSRKHKTVDRKFIVQSVEIEGVWVHWQCKASCEESKQPDKDAGIPKSYITGDDLKRMKRLNLFESCMLQINDKNYLKICESDVIVRKSQWKKEQSKCLNNNIRTVFDQFIYILGNKYRILSSKQSKPKVNTNETFDSNKIKLTKCDAEVVTKPECDKSKLCPIDKTNKYRLESDEWQTEEDDDEEMLSDSGTTASSCSSNPTPKGSPKKSPLLSHRIRKLKKHRQRSDIGERPIPQVNDKVVTEALVVYSWATVVWQDGTIESDIPSIDLCPIHHLDDHEFFPADFVLAANDSANANPSYRDYGVIQKVDHLGRLATVKWFSTYSNLDEPMPMYKGESVVSVYDLKDHPDFQYRPGTIVIRVANFTGDECSSAGQVVDNYPEGKVKVWWVNNSISMCWPQDLFEVGQYDSENNFWGNADSDGGDSWETEDEISEPGGMPQQQHLTANLERARVAMSRLEELFIINPNLQSQEVMKKLLMVYKKCRYLDRLMNTSFFHESNFMGLVERVRKNGTQTTAERLLEQKSRLFNGNSPQENSTKPLTKKLTLLEATKSSSNSNSHEDTSYFTASFESTKSCFNSTTNKHQEQLEETVTASKPTQNQLLVSSACKSNLSTSSDISSITDDNPDIPKLSLSPINRGNQEHSPKVVPKSERNYSDSGILITLDTGMVEGGESSGSLEMKSANSKDLDETGSSSSFVITVCAKLCSLIKMQLVKALQEINNRYCPSDQFKEVVELEMENKTASKAMSEGDSSLDEIINYETTIGSEKSEKEETDASNEESATSLENCDNFQILDNVPSTHKYHLTVFHPTNAQLFYKGVQKEHRLLKSSLPEGVWVRSFEDRLDLLSVLIEGPKNSPYEDGLFAFDIQLGHDYPRAPPLCHYISYCTDRLNPNLYSDGKVCVSLLGTWSGRGTEVWCANSSTLLQVIVSIQGLILVDQPYFNEAGYLKQIG